MNAILRRAEPGDFDAICELLHENMNAHFPVERWRKLFTHGWSDEDPDYGVVAVDGDKIVGFHGHICSHRRVGERRERFVNFTSWYILKPYRGNGLGRQMLEMATADPNTTYTVCSLSPKRVDFFKTLGLDVLDTERLLWRKDGHEYENLDFIDDPEVIAMRANPDEVEVLKDHAGLKVTPILLSTRCTQCLLLLSISVKKDDVTYYDVLYRSNPGLFSDRVFDIAEAILPDGNAVLAADRRFVEGDAPRAEVETLVSPRFYKTGRVKPRNVDLAYSEIVLLDLKLD
ncbi:GNAT family N-acetyltransferase [Pseudodesulfovibrio sp. zrk46]|uniref:GNAT family N-acetyltransferase n=1 Tax=Pseudodesulfovibrio sp. zrk46 TaxID=2725288 RepID=UPI001448FEC4|nr:GNAT family N-acetyltransferase [Pseudodesulfovibrio sp. zrk46]QJB55773.1 GNAT family N-acetyltransferase [Pseudodesulfovibrio sp. zrk46]